jgi:membrane protease YdiL (CAAX protease family)
MSLGAGVYEETVFRLGLLGGLVFVLEKLVRIARWAALLGAFLLSSAVFSAMHHLPPYGDPLELGPFVYRLLAGIFFGLLFWRRGFAVAVYTHAFYDIFVLVIR